KSERIKQKARQPADNIAHRAEQEFQTPAPNLVSSRPLFLSRRRERTDGGLEIGPYLDIPFALWHPNGEDRFVEGAALGPLDDGAELGDAHLDALVEVVGDDHPLRLGRLGVEEEFDAATVAVTAEADHGNEVRRIGHPIASSGGWVERALHWIPPNSRDWSPFWFPR